MKTKTETIIEEPITWARPVKMTSSRDQAIETYEEQKNAHLEWMDACESEENAKIWKAKAQKRLTMARDAVRALSIT